MQPGGERGVGMAAHDAGLREVDQHVGLRGRERLRHRGVVGAAAGDATGEREVVSRLDGGGERDAGPAGNARDQDTQHGLGSCRTGVPLAAAVEAADDLALAGGIARRGADHASVQEALAATEADVLVDFTKPGVVRGHADAAIAAGLHVVVGTSGLTADDYAELDAAARAAGRGVIAAGNFSVLAATLLHAATLAAGHVAHWEVIDYGSAGKPDVPSGTARELAEP